jgi:hypothetical protein
MIKNGEYAAWFRTSRGEGTGIVYLEDGRISGRDSMFVYGGRYEVEDNAFTATLTTKRYADGPTTTVFGFDEVEARLSGTFNGKTVVCAGSAAQAPSLRFEATLFPAPETPPPPQANRATVTTVAAKLPKGLDNRRMPARPGRVRSS